ncbi:MAG TPA: LytTR family DNA-binding domain-containing protein [Cyclobacteriaceae bacterium]|nr:LytTR family DNA-binding domain-containing protein [Cyclobacteriaceae bacterium]
MSIECLIVDDEPLAIRVIAKYLEKVPDLHLKATAYSAMETMSKLNQYEIDLVFLDIDMPEISGMDLIKSLSKKPSFIFVTAYREFAAEAFEVDAIDYLVKPVSFPRFLKAVNKFLLSVREKYAANENYLQIRSDRKTHKVYMRSILYIEGLKDYVKVHQENGEILITHKTMSGMENLLDGQGFIRCHKSYLVRISKIDVFTNEYLEISGKQIPIGRKYRKTAIENLGGL